MRWLPLGARVRCGDPLGQTRRAASRRAQSSSTIVATTSKGMFQTAAISAKEVKWKGGRRSGWCRLRQELDELSWLRSVGRRKRRSE